jgi:hypothetical protein
MPEQDGLHRIQHTRSAESAWRIAEGDESHQFEGIREPRRYGEYPETLYSETLGLQLINPQRSRCCATSTTPFAPLVSSRRRASLAVKPMDASANGHSCAPQSRVFRLNHRFHWEDLINVPNSTLMDLS